MMISYRDLKRSIRMARLVALRRRSVQLTTTGLCLPILAVFSFSASAQVTHSPGARARVGAALKAMGGEEALRSIGSLRLEATAHKYALEQSERPEGPWIVSYQKLIELHDLNGNQLRRTVTSQLGGYEFTQTTVLSGGIVATAFNQADLSPDAAGAEEWLALAPERVLLTALAASDLRAEEATVMQGVPHYRIAFTWQGIPVRIYLNQHTDLPTCVELTRPYPYDYFNVWGDVTTRTFYSFWFLKPGGIHYPYQWDVQQNGVTQASFFITGLEFNPTVPQGTFTIAENVKAAFRDRMTHASEPIKLGSARRPIQEIVTGIVQIPGGFNTTIVQQDDGLIILEAPVSSEYSKSVISEAHRRFPALPIKAVVTTSDAWPHIGGVREYVAQGIPMYALDLNQSILDRLVAAPHRFQPDALAQHPRKPIFKIVSSKTVVGRGLNRLELYPIRTETGERMMMAYFPEHRLLYASDLAQPFQSGSWIPQYLFELNTAVQRERLVVDRLFAMHMTPFAWSDVLGEIKRAVSAAND